MTENSLQNKTLVFSGPTLSGLNSFKKSLSDHFVFHPPAQCGNIIEAYREGFRRILIIDGYFEGIASVWHKEILDFIGKAGVIMGCSSMGALRALELERFGMLGFGEIFEDYKSGNILDDDEVTVIHLGEKQDFIPISDAMVNIRYTVKDAILKKILNDSDAENILTICKNTFFKKRNLDLLVKELVKSEPSLEPFQKYLKTYGIRDLKKEDAISLLKDINLGFTSIKKKKHDEAENTNTRVYQTIRHTLNINAPTLARQALSHESRILKMGRLLAGVQYKMLIQLASAMAHYSNFVKDQLAIAYDPVNWLDLQWFANDEKTMRLLALAFQDCPEYRTSSAIPLTVRHICFNIEFPIREIDLSTSHKFGLTRESLPIFSRLSYLLGLFLDARLVHDLFSQRVIPDQKSIQRAEAHCLLNGYIIEEEKQLLFDTYGIENLKDFLYAVERNKIILND